MDMLGLSVSSSKTTSSQTLLEDGNGMLHVKSDTFLTITIIDVGTLGEPAKNPSSLVPLECPIGLELMFEDLFVGDNISAVGCAKPSPKCCWT
jgi:hypothetical protein